MWQGSFTCLSGFFRASSGLFSAVVFQPPLNVFPSASSFPIPFPLFYQPHTLLLSASFLIPRACPLPGGEFLSFFYTSSKCMPIKIKSDASAIEIPLASDSTFISMQWETHFTRIITHCFTRRYSPAFFRLPAPPLIVLFLFFKSLRFPPYTIAWLCPLLPPKAPFYLARNKNQAICVFSQLNSLFLPSHKKDVITESKKT